MSIVETVFLVVAYVVGLILVLRSVWLAARNRYEPGRLRWAKWHSEQTRKITTKDNFIAGYCARSGIT